MNATWWSAEHAHLPEGLAARVLVEVVGGRFAQILTDIDPGDHRWTQAQHLPGVVLPGLANGHSHAFHRALRGRTHDRGGTFWTWREEMYDIASRLTPEGYLDLARGTYAEMALAGITAVGEFHYLHHDRDGSPYPDPNAMGHALTQAAAEAGIRLTLLDACYLTGGLTADGYTPLDGAQQRFSDGSVRAWAERLGQLRDRHDGGPAHLQVGAAIHSVRAVPRGDLAAVAAAARHRPGGPAPLHVHLSEQPAENDACLATHGLTPTALLQCEGVLDENLTAVHATHLTDGDIGALGRAGATACFCPTTERDLADGMGPARALLDGGARLSLGSDQHAVIDLIEEARALEMHERLDSLHRGRFTPDQLLHAATDHRSLGWQDAGRIESGARADLVAVRLDSVRTAGSDPAQILLSATASDVDTVLIDGELVVSGGRHRLGDIGQLLAAATS